MNDPFLLTPVPGTADQPPPKKRPMHRKGFYLTVILVILIAAVAFAVFSPMLDAPHATVGVSGGDEVLRAQVDNLTHRVESLENRVAALAANTTPPSAPAPDTPKPDAATAAEVAHMQSDMVALSAALSGLQAEVKATGATAAETRETSETLIASVVAFIQLREAASSGRAFTAELNVLRDVAHNDAALQAAVSKLEPLAASGAPTLGVLHEELLQREPAVAIAIAKSSAQNWWQRLMAELRGLVIVRPVHGGEGDALAQLESALSAGGANAALEAYKELPVDAQHNLADWQTQLEARQHLDEGVAAVAARFTALPAVKAP